MYSSPELLQRARLSGVCLMGLGFFNGLNVKNQCGSQTFGDGYASWTQERQALRPRPPPFPPWPPGTDMSNLAALPVDPRAIISLIRESEGGEATSSAALRGAARAANRRAERVRAAASDPAG